MTVAHTTERESRSGQEISQLKAKQSKARTEDAVQVGEVGREVERGVDRHEDPVEPNRQPVDDMREPVPFTAPANEDR
jgi:hypothetical protein